MTAANHPYYNRLSIPAGENYVDALPVRVNHN